MAGLPAIHGSLATGLDAGSERRMTKLPSSFRRKPESRSCDRVGLDSG